MRGQVITAAMVAQMRSAQESLMGSTVLVTDPAGASWVHIDGQDVRQAGDTVYAGKAKVQDMAAASKLAAAGATDVTVADHVVVLPFTALDVRPGHEVLVQESPDPFLVGLTLTVTGVAGNDLGTARRCEAVLIM